MATEISIQVNTENKTISASINGQAVENVKQVSIEEYSGNVYCTIYTAETEGDVTKRTSFSVKASELERDGVKIVSKSKVEHDIEFFLGKR